MLLKLSGGYMKALTIRQPWAWAIINAGKDIENRSWRTHIRATIAVHTAVTMSRKDYEDSCGDIVLATRNPRLKIPAYDDLERGAIIGTVEIVDCVEEADSQWFQGEYGFVLVNPKRLPQAIPCKGALNFWNVPEDIERRIKNTI
jgi:hypothetical protein